MDLTNAYQLEQCLLTKQLAVVRASLDHPGEKGVALEEYVRRFLRHALPQEYGITTGFIAYPPDFDSPRAPPTLSGQLDIIIYDALHGSPLLRLPTCDVLPLEAVIAYVEVKAKVSSTRQHTNSIYRCAEQAQKVRKHTTRWFWASTGAHSAQVCAIGRCVSTRSYVFAFEGPKDAKKAQKALREATENLGEDAELSGMFINDCGFFRTRPNHAPEVNFMTGNAALGRFRYDILHSLARFPRYAPDFPCPNIPCKDLDEQDGAVIEPLKTITAFLDHYAPSDYALDEHPA